MGKNVVVCVRVVTTIQPCYRQKPQVFATTKNSDILLRYIYFALYNIQINIFRVKCSCSLKSQFSFLTLFYCIRIASSRRQFSKFPATILFQNLYKSNKLCIYIGGDSSKTPKYLYRAFAYINRTQVYPAPFMFIQ